VGFVEHRVICNNIIDLAVKCEGLFSLLVGNDSDIVGREPATLVSQQPVPPPGRSLCQHLHNIILAKGEAGGILTLIVIESPTEERREGVVVFLLLGLIVMNTHSSNVEKSSHYLHAEGLIRAIRYLGHEIYLLII
jgi:hypothetical protein